ncbi:MAG: formylglycine-generating enzyme family protein, partial [Deltaproteobacteria bacterium]|nr:formylglycine-generating enzyme family protein [Deltaproteobacteria bacterium]
ADSPITMAEFMRLRKEHGLKGAWNHVREILSGTHYFWQIRVEGRGKVRRYLLDDPITDPKNPKSNRDPEGDPILPEQPISSISADAAQKYIDWRSQRDGRNYRLAHPDEAEKVARGSLPFTYPWGYDFDPNFLASRLVHQGLEDCFPHPVGQHPLGPSMYRDASLYGSLDVLGNIREFVAAPGLPTLIGLFGGSIRVPYGPFYLPSARVYQTRGAAEDGIGSFRLVEDLVPPGNDESL